MSLRVICVCAALMGAVACAAGPMADAPDELRLPIHIANGDAEDGFLDSDLRLAEWAFADWARATGGGFTTEQVTESLALIRLYWAPASGGQYGEMRPIVVGDEVGAEVFVRPDVASLGASIADQAANDPLFRDVIVYLTCLHELGHALGLSHTDDFADIMYSFQYGGDFVEYFARYRRRVESLADIQQISGLSTSDVDRIRARFAD